MAIFKDEEMPPPPVPSTAKTPGKPKSGIMPFKDEASFQSLLLIDLPLCSERLGGHRHRDLVLPLEV